MTQVTDACVVRGHCPYHRRPADQAREHMIMKLNLGRLNRTLRIVASPAWIGLAATGTVGAWG